MYNPIHIATNAIENYSQSGNTIIPTSALESLTSHAKNVVYKEMNTFFIFKNFIIINLLFIIIYLFCFRKKSSNA